MNIDWARLFLSADGRIGRQTFWIAVVILFIANAVLVMIPIIGWLVNILLFWSAIAVFTKRLHDFGRTGWWQIVPAPDCSVGHPSIDGDPSNSAWARAGRRRKNAARQ